MTSQHNSREGACRNNAVQFHSCNGGSYCTAQGENDCTDILKNYINNYMILFLYWFSILSQLVSTYT